MKKLSITCCLIIVISTQACDNTAKVKLSSNELNIVNAYIKSKERISTDIGESRAEFQDARKYIKGDINGDKIPDLIVQYTLEEGNNWTIYIAVFEEPSMKLIAAKHIGGKGYRIAELSKVKNGLIEIGVQLYSTEDALCCPSVPGTAYYLVKKNSLNEARLIVDRPDKPVK
jgi:hypothetical protein